MDAWNAARQYLLMFVLCAKAKAVQLLFLWAVCCWCWWNFS